MESHIIFIGGKSMKKIWISFILVTLMIFTLAAAVSADEVKVSNTKDEQVGTPLTIEDLCKSDSDPDVTLSAFDKFGFYKNKSSSGGARFYFSNDSSMKVCYPDIGGGRYAYGVYTPSKDYDNYHVQFMAEFDKGMLKVAKEGALQIRIEATTTNKNGTFNDETGVIGFKALDAYNNVVMETETNTGTASGTKQVEIDWKTLPKNTAKIMITMRSVRHGLGTQPKNRSSVQNPYVYFRDVSKPYVTEVGIVEDEAMAEQLLGISEIKGDWVQRTNNAGKTYRTKGIGDEILYYVKFNENINVISGRNSRDKWVSPNRDTVRLGVIGRNGDSYRAGYIDCKGDTMYFRLEITNASSYLVYKGEGGMAAAANAHTLYIDDGVCICDGSSNKYAGGYAASISSKWKNSVNNLVVDDSYPALAKEMTDENGIYPAKYLTSQTFNLYGSMPAELIGTPSTGKSGNANIQPTLFSANGEKGMIFRIVINEEILKSSLNANTKLLLNIFDSSYAYGTGIAGNAYADLVAARYIGSNTNASYGIKNNVVTEMFFRFVPTADVMDGKEVWYVQPALWNNPVVYKGVNATYGISVDGVTASGGVLTTNGELLMTASGYPVDLQSGTNHYLRPGILYGAHVNGLDADRRIMVDTKAPQYAGNNLPTDWVSSIPSYYSKIYFTEGDDISYDGVKLSIYYIDDSGVRKNVRFSMNGSDPGETILVPAGYEYSGKYFVTLDGISFPDSVPSDREMYVEYTISDRAGNTATNEGEKNIVLKIDRKGPVVNGSTATVDGTYASVKYDVVDEGVEKLHNSIYYRVEKIGEALDTTSYSQTYNYDDSRTIGISGDKNSYDTWRVWANFGDSLGNRTKVDGNDSELLFTPSDEIEMADRYFKLGVKSENAVGASHNVTLSNFYISDKDSDYTINLYYKWVKGSTNDSKENYRKLSFTDFDSVSEINFADESVIREFIYGKIPANVKDIDKEYPIIGEYTFIAYAELLPEEEMQYNIIQTVYFDKTAPTADLRVYEVETDDGPAHTIRYFLEDDGAKFKYGYYVTNGNISFENLDTVLRIYADDRIVVERELAYRNDSLTYDLNDCDFLKGLKKVRYELTVTDNFGNSAVFNTDEYDLDFVNPEIGEFEVKGNDNLKLVEEGEIPVYAVADITDIRSISVKVSDNMDKRVEISHLKGGSMTSFPANADAEMSDNGYEREYVYSNPVFADFHAERKDDLLLYKFTVYAVDDWGNSASRYFYVICDLNKPGLSVVDEGLTDMTSVDSRRIKLYCLYEPYELFYRDNEELGGLKFELTAIVDGEKAEGLAKVVESEGYDYFTIEVSDNCTVIYEVTDPFGNTDSVSVKVDNFDRSSPEITLDTDSIEQTPAGSQKTKYGSMTFVITDNRSVVSKSSAVVPLGKTPAADDYFTGEHIFTAGETGGAAETQAEEEVPHTVDRVHPYGTARFENNTLSYYALPEGVYSVWVRAVDSAGNVTEVRIAEINSDNTGASCSSVEYSPAQATAGQVVVTVNTDIPVTRIYGTDEDGILGAMLGYIEEQREEGFTYIDRDGKKVTVKDIADIIDLYNTVKDMNESQQLDAYNAEIYKNAQTSDTFDPYKHVLSFDYNIQPAEDILDYLHNITFYSMDDNRNISPETPRLTDYIYDSALAAEYGFDSWNEYSNINAVDVLKDFGLVDINNDMLTYDFEGTSIVNMDVLAYPTAFDRYPYNVFIPSAFERYVIEEKTKYVNPFHNSSFISADLLHDMFGDDIPAVFIEDSMDEDIIEYVNPFTGASDLEYLTYEQLTEAGLGDYLDSFEVKEQFYRNPFVADNEREYTVSDMEKLFNAIGLLQRIRENTANKLAEKYASVYLDYTKQEYSTTNRLKFRDNVDKNIRFIDYTGQILSVPVKIDWIDKTLPHVPEEYIEFSYNGDELERIDDFSSTYCPVNYPDVEMKVSIPKDIIDNLNYVEYFILVEDLPKGAEPFEYDDNDDMVPIDEGDIYCKGFTLEVTQNGVIPFSLVNPTSEQRAVQVAYVDFFDRTPPKADLVITPEKPENGITVNTDVSVTLENLSDNFREYDPQYSLFCRKAGTDDPWKEIGTDHRDNGNQVVWDGIKAVFKENTEEYEYKFVLIDKAGNTSDIPFDIDFIDKSPVEFDVKLFRGETPISIEDPVTINSDNPSAMVYEYTVNDDRFWNEPLTVEVYLKDTDTKVASDTIVTTAAEWACSYTSPGGNSASMRLTGFKFDTTVPEGYVSYTLEQPGGGAMSYIVASITVLDDHPETLTVQSVTGRLTDGTAITVDNLTVAGYLAETGKYTASMVFNYNGFADIVFADAAGNQFCVQISVTGIDRTAPRAFIEYSTTKPTNNDVQAMIFLTEPAEYRIIDSSDRILIDYSGSFSNVVYHTFKDNGNLFFQFRDADGNETEALIAYVNNIDKTAPELEVVKIHRNKALDMENNLVDMAGFATIELEAVSDGDTLGGDQDNIIMLNANQSKYHTVNENGTYVFNFGDEAGNFGTLKVDVDVIDEIAPKAEVKGNPTSWTNTPPEITIKAVQTNDCSCDDYIVLNGVNHKDAVFSPSVNGVYTYVLRDGCGNTVTEYINVEFVDTAAPTITLDDTSDIYVHPGEFTADVKAEFEKAVCADEGGSGLVSEICEIDYGSFDQNVPGDYYITFTAYDNAGNSAAATRVIHVIGEDDVFVLINDVTLLPGSQTTFWNGEDLELTFINAEKSGDKISYAFEKGFFNGAEMKGSIYKKLTTPDAKIQLEADEKGMYTLFVQTENRKTMVMYVFVAGSAE